MHAYLLKFRNDLYDSSAYGPMDAVKKFVNRLDIKNGKIIAYDKRGMRRKYEVRRGRVHPLGTMR